MKNLFLVLVLIATSFNLYARPLDPLVLAEDERDSSAVALKMAATDLKSERRERAAVAYGHIRKVESVDPLLKLLKDSDWSVRKAAAFALGQLGYEASSSGGREKEIAAQLVLIAKSDGEISVRAGAVEALGKIGLLETPNLMKPFLEDKSVSVRSEAVLALFRFQQVLKLRKPSEVIAPLPAPIFDCLKTLTDDSEVQVRRNVAYYFARVKDGRGLDLLTKLSSDGNLWIRYFAVQGLVKLADPASSDILVKKASDYSYHVRVAAVNGLSALKSAQLLPEGLALDPNYHVRAAFALALGGSEKSDVSLLNQLMSDSSVAVQASALEAFAQRQKDGAHDVIVKSLKNSNWILREAAVHGIGSLQTGKEDLVRGALKDKDVRVRTAALEGLSALSAVESFQLLVKALQSKELSERGTAVDTLSQRQEPEKVDQAWKTYQNSQDARWTEVRENLVDLLGAVPGQATTDHLLVMLKDGASSVTAKAHQALLDRGVAHVTPLSTVKLTHTPFRDLQFDFHPVVVLETNRGLIQIMCYREHAQIHVANFVGQVRKGFYNGLPWHRVVSNFVVQGGDPDKTGWGDAGYSLRAEINTVRFDRGTLGMPRSQGFDTGGVQLFLNHVPTPHLDGLYTVFGQVITGLDVLDRLERGDRIIKAHVLGDL